MVGDILVHYGIPGMHWGKHKAQLQGIDKARTANLDSWGKDPEHNILYVTGYSGSGKSTLAKQLADSKTNVIHLDPYFEKMDNNIASSLKDKEFTSYLDKNYPKYKIITRSSKINPNDKELWDTVDTMMEHTEKFARQQFYKNKKVIVEGVQLSDNTTYPNKEFFRNKPLIIMGTNPITSFYRASKRDGRHLPNSISLAKEYIQTYKYMRLSLNKLSEHANAKAGKEWVKKYIAEH